MNNEAYAYQMNCWDCPVCGYRNQDDAELALLEVCEDCGEESEIC